MIYKSKNGNYVFSQSGRYYFYTGEEFFLIENGSCVTNLADGQLIVDEDKYEIVNFQDKGEILALYVILTDRCNFKCPQCIVDAAIDKKRELDSNLLWDFILQLKEIGLKSISLSGGEPSLYKDLPLILNKILNNELEVQITTNGSLPRVWENVGETNLKHISFRVSLYGNNFEYRTINNCSRDIVLKTLLFLKDKAKSVIALLPQDDHFSNDVNIDFCVDNKIQYQLGNVFSLGRYADCPPKDRHNLIVPEGTISPGPYPCMLKKLTILSSGDIVFCPAVDSSFGLFGHYEERALDIVQSKVRRDLIDSINVDNKSTCSKCELKYLCRGGCLATYLENEVPLGDVHPYCPFNKKGGDIVEIEEN